MLIFVRVWRHFGGVVWIGVSVGRYVIVVLRRFSLSGFGVVPIVVVWLGVRVWCCAQLRGTAQVQRWARRRITPPVVVFTLRRVAAETALRFGISVKMLGFGVGVRLGVRFWCRGSSRH